MRRRLIVKFNCLVLLFVGVGYSYGLGTSYQTVYQSSGNLLSHGYTQSSTSGGYQKIYHTGPQMSTSNGYQTIYHTEPQISTSDGYQKIYHIGPQISTSGGYQTVPQTSTSIRVNPLLNNLNNFNNNGANGWQTHSQVSNGGTIITTKTVTKRICTVNGIPIDCGSSTQQATHSTTNVITIKYGISIESVISQLTQFSEFRNVKFISCTCKDSGVCSCQGSTYGYTRSQPCYCLCIQSNYGESKCACSSHIFELDIKSTTALEGCLCYNTGEGTALKCYCRKIDNNFAYNSNKYTSIEVQVRNTKNIVSFRDEIYNILSQSDRNYNYCTCRDFGTDCRCNAVNYIHNGISNCLCLDERHTSKTVGCICGPYYLQPKIKYTNANVQGCKCIFVNDETICQCTKYNPSGITNNDIHKTKIIYQYAKISLTITVYSVQIIIQQLQQFTEFRNERFDVCTCKNYRDCSWKNQVSYTIRNPGYCLCFKESHGAINCVCNPHILEIQIRNSENVEGCFCYNNGGNIQCTCKSITNFGIYDENKYTSLEIQILNLINEGDIRWNVLNKFSSGDNNFRLCRCKEFGSDCVMGSYTYYQDGRIKCRDCDAESYNSISNCLCIDDGTDPERKIACICNPYILQPKIKYQSTRHLQACYCILTKDVTICKCNPYAGIRLPLPNPQPSVPYPEPYIPNPNPFVPNPKPYVPQPTKKPYNTNGIIDLVPLGRTNIDYLVQYFQNTIEFRSEHFHKCTCERDDTGLECTCDKPTWATYKFHKPGYCLCFDPMPNGKASCLCNLKILTPQFRYNKNDYTLKGCICVHNIRSDIALSCSCRDIEPNPTIDITKYTSVEVELLSNYKTMRQIWYVISSNFREIDKGSDMCGCYGYGDATKGDCTLNYHRNGLSPCLCLKDGDRNYISTCICNPYILQVKLRYNKAEIPLKNCYCIPYNEKNRIYCKCSDHTNTGGATGITSTTTTTTTPAPRPIVYDYSRILILIPENGVTIQIIYQLYLQRIEFKNQEFNRCACVVKPGDKYKCSCTQSTRLYTKENPSNCLCVHSYNKNSMEECLCNEHVLQPYISYSTAEIYLFDCSCYSSGENVNSISCDCKKRLPYGPNYSSVLLDIRYELQIDIQILMDYFRRREEYKLEQFRTCSCTDNSEKLPCSCTEMIYQYTNQNPLNCLCIVYRSNIPKLSQCLCSKNILLADITYNINLIELQECVCNYNSNSVNNQQSTSCNCRRKESFNPNYEILVDISYARTIINVINVFKRKYAFKHENFVQCTSVNGFVKCPSTVGKQVYTKKNLYNCLCIYQKTSNTPNCACSYNVVIPDIIYNIKTIQMEECTCDSEMSKCNCFTKKSFQPKYSLILIKIPETTIDITIILRYIKERWEFSYEEIDQCKGNIHSKTAIVNCQRRHNCNSASNYCNCLCVFYKDTNIAECLCSPNILEPSITYSKSNKLKSCKCLQSSNSLQLNCLHCTKKLSFNPRYDLLLLEYKSITIISIEIIRKSLHGFWQFRHENFNNCHGDRSKSYLIITCKQKTQTCTKKNNCNCLCVFHKDKNTIECLCSDHILLPKITYNSIINDLQGCTCHHIGKDNQLSCNCVKKQSFEPNYSRILMKFEILKIHINIIKKFLENRQEFEIESFNDCNSTSINSPITVSCTKPTLLCHENHCNCLCIFDHDTSRSECLCSTHVLLPNITYNSNFNDIQGCKCHHIGNIKENKNQMKCECIKKPSFEPKYKQILIEWYQIKIEVNIIIKYILERWEYQYEEYNLCKGSDLKSPLKLTCTEITENCTTNNQCNCLCVFHQTKKVTECVCSRYILEPNITYSKTINNLQGCACVHKGNSKQLSCNCAQKVSFEPKYELVYINLHKETIVINIILQYLRYNWQFQYEIFNRCTSKNIKSLIFSCTDNTVKCNAENPCNCLCVFNSTINEADCLCSPHVLLPNITYSTTINDLEGCTCIHVNGINGNGHQLSCNCIRKPSYEPRFDLILFEWGEVNIKINIIYKYIKQKWHFQHDIFNQCKGTSLTSPLILTCSENTQACVDKNHCNCLCVFDHKIKNVECLCSEHVLLPNHTYNVQENDLQDCICLNKEDANKIECNCEKKPTFKPNYDILIELRQERLQIIFIYTFLQQRWEYQYESFNYCNGTNLNSPLALTCSRNTQRYIGSNHCNCLCLFNKIESPECLCSTHVLQPNITYSIKQNNLQACNCLHKGNFNQLTCKCVQKPSFEPNYKIILIKFPKGIININIIIKYIKERWEYRYEAFKHCNGISSQTIATLTCKETTKFCSNTNYCNCLCVFNNKDNTVECLCNNHILLPNITYTTNENNIQGCICLQKGKDNQLSCNCHQKVSYSPKYNLIWIQWRQEIHINIVLEYFEKRWEYQHEVFNLCTGNGLKSQIRVNCKNQVHQCTEKNRCNCLCVFYQATGAIECLCNSNILLPDITYNTTQNDLQKCTCFHINSTNLICDCVHKTSFEPNYDSILIRYINVKITIKMIITYLQEKWQFKYEVFNQCNGKNLNTLTCAQKIQICSQKYPCNCLCISHKPNTATECLCSDHIFLPNITYSTSLNDIQKCECIYKDNTNHLTCNCVRKVSYEPKFDVILFDWTYVRIDITYIFTYIREKWQFQHEEFNACKGNISKDHLDVMCVQKTQICTVKNHCNCLCVFPESGTVNCLCNNHILVPSITYNTTLNNLQGCTCEHKGKSNQMACKCVKTSSFEPRCDLILIQWINVKIDIKIIIEYFRQKKEYRYEVFNLCNGTNLESPITLMCTEKVNGCTENNKCNCLCIFHSANSATECFCNRYILLPNITYTQNENELKECRCFYKGDNYYLTCDCNKKPSFEPAYDILIEWSEVKIDIITILNYLKQRWEFQYEIFSICSVTDVKSPLTITCSVKPQIYMNEKHINCLCLFNQNPTKCICSPHVLQPNITYNVDKNNLQECQCIQQGSSDKLTCNCARKVSFEPKYNLILIEFKTVVINIDIILTSFKQRWEYKHEVFYRCKGANLKSTLTCNHPTKIYTGNNHQNCLCLVHSKPSSVDCLCSTHVLMPNITYSIKHNDLHGCICSHGGNDKQLKCNCVEKPSFEPDYKQILIEFYNIKIHINIILKFIEERWEYQYETFNQCNGTNLKQPLKCTEKTNHCTKKDHCNCLCLFDQSSNTVECLCNRYILLPNITYSINLNDIQGCACIHKDGGNLLTCNCEKKPSFEHYDILVEWKVRIDVRILRKYLEERWEFQHEVFNQCKTVNNSPNLYLTCSEKTELCTEKNHCNCLCIYDFETHTTECLCSQHIHQLNITYTKMNKIDACTCFHKGENNQLQCICENKPSYNPYGILVVWKDVYIDMIIIQRYLEERWEFKHEVFNLCKRTDLKSSELTCTHETKICTQQDNCNCLCRFDKSDSSTVCLCSSHIFLVDIVYNTSSNDLQACKCHHKGNSKQIICNCEKKEPFDPNYSILIEWLEIRIDINTIITYFIEQWEFRHEILDVCNSVNSETPFTLSCKERNQVCLEKGCNCLCIFDKNINSMNCVCGTHVLIPNITYSTNINDIRACKCSYDVNSNQMKCNCVQKETYQPSYDILIEVIEVKIDITIIYTYLKQRWEFEYEVFNTCTGTNLKSLICNEGTDLCNDGNYCNCLCIQYTSSKTECLCSTHVLLPNITYNTGENKLQGCKCHQNGKFKQLTCNCIDKPSFKPNYDLILIEIFEQKITIKIILSYLRQFWEFKHEKFNNCKGTTSKSAVKLTCSENTKVCSNNKHCNCLCVSHHGNHEVECLCSKHILQSNITYNTNLNILKSCTCVHHGNDKQVTCNCKEKSSFDPNYKLILINLSQVTVKVNIISIILQYLEQRWEYQYEIFNTCKGTNLKSPLIINCINETHDCVKKNKCHCLCVFDHATTTTECLCSPHVVQPNITYNTNLFDIQGCECFHNSNTKQLTCNCNKRISYEPNYRSILIVWQEVKIDINIIIKFIQNRWEYQYEDYKLCNGTNLKSPITIVCNRKTDDCTKDNRCNCLCVFHQATSLTECYCSSHVLVPNITYNMVTNNLQGCLCFYEGDDKQLTCNCEKKLSFNPRYDILIEWIDIRIEIITILTYLRTSWEFQYETFYQCRGINDKSLSCDLNTEGYKVKNLNCLCVFHEGNKKNAVECLCSTHILLPNIKYNTSLNDLKACTCIHNENSHHLECECKSKQVFAPNYDLILIKLNQVSIAIIRSYLLIKWQFQYEKYIDCSGTSLNDPVTLTCTENMEIYTKNKYCNCLCVFYHETDTADCSCSDHITLVTFDYNSYQYDIEACKCQHSGNSNQILCNCFKKPSFEPRYNHIFYNIKTKITIEDIWQFFRKRYEFRFESLNKLDCSNSATPLNCKWNDIKSVSIQDATSYNCLCLVNSFPNNPSHCVCSEFIFEPDIRYDININKLESCICKNSKDPNQLICDCKPKESFDPNYKEVQLNFGDQDVNVTISYVLQYLLKQRQFRHEKFIACDCQKINLNLQCNCEDDVKLYTKQKQGDCLCIWKSPENPNAKCLCSDHILDVEYVFYSKNLNLGNCSCYNSGSNIQSLICECIKMESADRRYVNIQVDVSMANEITGVAKRISQNFGPRDVRDDKTCAFENYKRCLKPVNDTEKNPLPYLCLDSKENKHYTGCVQSSYLVQPIILYNQTKFNLYRCYYESEWKCNLVHDRFRIDKHFSGMNVFQINTQSDSQIINKTRTIIKYVNVPPQSNTEDFFKLTGPQYKQHIIQTNTNVGNGVRYQTRVIVQNITVQDFQ